MKTSHICSRCKTEKPNADFYTDNSYLGHASWCKECAKEHQRQKTKPAKCPHCKAEFMRVKSQAYCSLECAFWARVTKKGEQDCWEWSASRDVSGYGIFTFLNIRYLANRVALDLTIGPSHLFALHSCDNPPCCNHNHLRWGTQQENMAEAIERGRRTYPSLENGYRATLTNQQVSEIRCLLGEERQIDIAKQFNVKRSLIADISAGRSWRNQ